jgi:muramidase (phage lysozyme)
MTPPPHTYFAAGDTSVGFTPISINTRPYRVNDLKDVPQPVVVLLEKLLKKDPAHSSAAGLYQIFNRINADRRRRSAGAHHAGEQLDRITLEM